MQHVLKFISMGNAYIYIFKLVYSWKIWNLQDFCYHNMHKM